MNEIENPFRSPIAAGKSPTPIVASTLRKPLSWFAAVSSSIASIYGPYAVMTLYTQFYVSCDHCKQATLNLLAFAPGMLPLDLAQRALGIGSQDDWRWFSCAALVAVVWVIGLTLLLRRSWRIGAAGALLSTAVCAYLAFVLLALIRM
jgi:hypothetical protein